jgi:2-(1,2-epoxy-1,2-dihydrophenyl)acetyl-CoA isomerase
MESLDDPSTGSVLIARSGEVMTLTLNRPEVKNAMDSEGWEKIGDAVRIAERDSSVRALVVTGAGSNFCSGADISGPAVGHPLTRMNNLARAAKALHNFPKPVIAKVRGVAVGAGWNLALCCDFVVAEESARFSQIFAKRGLSVDFGGTWLLPRLVGLQQAKLLAYLADFVSADHAKALGLVTWVKLEDEIDTFVDGLSSRLAAMPPVAIAQDKKMLNGAFTRTFEESLEDETRSQAVNYATEDASLARVAFRESRTPAFTGRWLLDRVEG